MSIHQSFFLKSFFAYLNENGVRYAVARNAATLPESIPGSDIDLLVVPADLRKCYGGILETARHAGYRVWKRYRKNHSILQVSFVPLEHCSAEAVVRVDFLLDGVFWFGLPVLGNRDWLAGRVLKNGVWQIDGPLMVAATLANTWLYGGRVKERYLAELSNLPESGQQEVLRLLDRLFGHCAAANLSILSQGGVEYDRRATRRAFLFSSGWKFIFVLSGAIGVVRTLISRFFNPPGVFVVLHGPDGCGKSTISSELKKKTAQLFPDILHFHLFPKPGLLSFLDRQSQHRWENRQKSASEWELRQCRRGMFRSLIQIAYLTFRYWAGYLLCVLPALVKGKLVLGERWNLDFLTDPSSKGIDLPLSVRRFFYGICPRPKKLILLTGDANAMAARKPELPADEIARQIELNRLLFGSFRRAVFVDSTVKFEETLEQAMTAVIV